MPPKVKKVRASVKKTEELIPPPEIGQITRFCDDVLRHRRPQRLVMVKPMPLQSVRIGTQPLQLLGVYGPIPQEEVTVWPSLFKAQDIEVVHVERFLEWLKRMQTGEVHWLFATPDMTYPPRPLAPFLEDEAPVWDAKPPAAQPPAVRQPAVQPAAKSAVEGQLSAAAPAKPRVVDETADGFIPGKRPRAYDGGFVPTGEEAEQMRRSLALRRPLREPFTPIMEQGWGEGPSPMLQAAGQPARPPLSGAKVTWGSPTATPREMTYLAQTPEPVTGSMPIPYPNASPAAAGALPRAGFPYAVPLAILGGVVPAFAGGMTTSAAAGGQLGLARVPSPFGGSIPVPYLHFAGAGQPGAPGAGQPQAGLPSQAAWGAPSAPSYSARYYASTSPPVTGSMPVPYPTTGAAYTGGATSPGTVYTGSAAAPGGFPYAIPLAVMGGFGPAGARPMMVTSTGSWASYLRAPSATGGAMSVPYLQLPVNAAGFMAGGQPQPGGMQQPPPLAPGALLTNPYLGQMTLIAPPLRVASEEAEDSGTAMSFQWQSLAKGHRPLDPRALSALRQSLPEGSQLIYPALPKGQLPAGAVNLRLAQPTVAQMLATGYGVPPAAGVASRVINEMEATLGASPTSEPLTGHIVPGKRPAGTKPSLLPTGKQPGGALSRIGSQESHRDGELGFLGMPISLAPRLGGRSEVREAVSSGVAQDTAAKTIRPNVFNALRHLLFPSFQSVEAEPDQRAWHKAAPSFGLPDSKPTTVLSPHARTPLHTPTASLPQLGGTQSPPPGAIPLLHGADVSPLQQAAGVLGSLPPPSPGALPHPVFGMSPFSMPGQLPSPRSAAVVGRPPAGNFQPIIRPFIGSALPGLLPGLLPGAPPPPPRPRAFSGLSGTFGHHGPQPEGGPLPLIGLPPMSPLHHLPVVPSGPGEDAGHPMTLSRPPAMPTLGPLGQHAAGQMPSMPSMPPAGLPSIFQPRLPHAPHLPFPTGGDARAPMPDMRLPVPQPMGHHGGMQALTTLVSRAPQMLYTPPAPRFQQQASLAIQRSITIGDVESTVQQPEQSRADQATARSDREGMQAAEVNVLATEVWSILKQRLATEAIRRGRW